VDLQGKQGEIKIYTTPYCPFCVRAKKLLRAKQVAFQEVDVSFKPGIRQELRDLTGRTSVPNIFIHGNNIGGCDELYALERAGRLDEQLAGVPAP
jgi:glutaredoxin 3